MSSTMIRRLQDVRMADAAEVGGKAASLGELLAAGVRVPDGVVLTAGAGDMTADDRGSVVRAGLTGIGSFAGMYESVLDVATDELPAATDRVLTSASAAHVAEYKPDTSGRRAVIIQSMVRPAAAGVALTADPINGRSRPASWLRCSSARPTGC